MDMIEWSCAWIHLPRSQAADIASMADEERKKVEGVAVGGLAFLVV